MPPSEGFLLQHPYYWWMKPSHWCHLPFCARVYGWMNPPMGRGARNIWEYLK